MDVYDAIPTIVTTFVAIIAKISILIFLLELVYYTGQSKFGFNWTYILLISSFLSLMVGAIVGLVQFRIKRLLAYSTVSLTIKIRGTPKASSTKPQLKNCWWLN